MLTISQQAEQATRAGNLWRVPSSSIPNCRRTVRTDTESCSCPGFLAARKHGHPCRHLQAVYLVVAREALEIVGQPDAEGYETAARWIENGMLAGRYLVDRGDAPRYGSYPNRRAGIEWSIGLTERARRKMTRFETAACLWSLRRLAFEAQQERRAA